MIVPADILETGLRITFTNDADWNAPIETGTLIFRARPLGFGYAPESMQQDGVHMTCARVHGVRRNNLFIRPGFLIQRGGGSVHTWRRREAFRPLLPRVCRPAPPQGGPPP